MITQVCKKRRAVYISSESEDSATDSEVEGSKLSQRSGVKSISTGGHQLSYKKNVDFMNTTKIRLCGKILNKLLDHKLSLLFRVPVDPVQYGIPDYFDVIRNPMDLGTVKKKLTNKQYVSPDEFAADVRLTFSNAMTYNPPGNVVHNIAKELNGIFDSEWASVESKLRDRNPIQQPRVIKARADVDSKSVVARGQVTCLNSKSVVAKGPVPCSSSLVKRTLSDAISSKVKIKFSVRSSEQTSSKDMPLQVGGSRESSSNHFLAASNREGSLNLSLPCTKETAKISKIQATEHNSESVGTESRSCNDTSTSPLASSGQEEESYLHDEPLSPSRALRAAMLRSRFAGTIVKAQQKALLDHGKNVDPVKLQLEKERLEKRQQEEKARIEAQVKAAEAAAQLKLEEEMRRKREKEREAARLALRMMKKTVDIDNSDFLKELENFSKTWQSNPPGKLIVDFVDGIELPPGLGSPLERLGLFMKKDFEEEVEHEMEESESPSKKDSEEEIDHEMEESESPSKKDSEEVEHEMEESESPSKKDSEEDVDHGVEDSVSPSTNVDVEEGEISCFQ
ncbi:hypothetical protein ACP70R_003905 [Stipagrostis hirtigluma subsp. patula]